jgi:hypothetical protein
MEPNDKKIAIIVWAGGAVILVITFGKLLWVRYFSIVYDGQKKPFWDLFMDTIPLFLLVICFGLFMAWLRNRNSG